MKVSTMTFGDWMKEVEQKLAQSSGVLALRAGTAAGRTEGGREKLHAVACEQFAQLLKIGQKETSLPADALAMLIAEQCPTLVALRRGSLPRI